MISLDGSEKLDATELTARCLLCPWVCAGPTALILLELDYHMDTEHSA